MAFDRNLIQLIRREQIKPEAPVLRHYYSTCEPNDTSAIVGTETTYTQTVYPLFNLPDMELRSVLFYLTAASGVVTGRTCIYKVDEKLLLDRTVATSTVKSIPATLIVQGTAFSVTPGGATSTIYSDYSDIRLYSKYLYLVGLSVANSLGTDTYIKSSTSTAPPLSAIVLTDTATTPDFSSTISDSPALNSAIIPGGIKAQYNFTLLSRLGVKFTLVA